MLARARKFQFQYRLVWHYKGEVRVRKYVSDNPGAVIRMLHRVGGEAPELGVNATQLKRSWAWLARRLNVGFAAVADIRPSEILTRLQNSFPNLEFVRVEQRQVGEWTTTLDPLTTLRTPTMARAEAKRTALLAQVEAMTPAELDAWRWVPNEAAQAMRTRGDGA